MRTRRRGSLSARIYSRRCQDCGLRRIRLKRASSIRRRFRLQAEFHIPRPASKVWGDLTAEKPGGWCRILREITWTSPRPFGVGTTRTVRTVGGIDMLSERFFCWDEGRRQPFYVLKASSPLYRASQRTISLSPLLRPHAGSPGPSRWSRDGAPGSPTSPTGWFSKRSSATLASTTASGEPMATPWDARTYDRSSEPRQAWGGSLGSPRSLTGTPESKPPRCQRSDDREEHDRYREQARDRSAQRS